MANTVRLKGIGTRLERVAAGTITPGMLIEVTNADKVQAHSTAKGPAITAFAVENDLEGKEISDNYSANDYVQSEIYRPGDEVLTFVKAGGSALVIGDFLESAGNGSLQKYTDGYIIAQALEAVDNSGGGSMARLKVRVL